MKATVLNNKKQVPVKTKGRVSQTLQRNLEKSNTGSLSVQSASCTGDGMTNKTTAVLEKRKMKLPAHLQNRNIGNMPY